MGTLFSAIKRFTRSSSMLALAVFSFCGKPSPLAFRSHAIMMQETVAEVPVAQPPPPPPAISVMRVGDKTLAGDWGFDPLQLAGWCPQVRSPCIDLRHRGCLAPLCDASGY